MIDLTGVKTGGRCPGCNAEEIYSHYPHIGYGYLYIVCSADLSKCMKMGRQVGLMEAEIILLKMADRQCAT